ncbi:amidase family protein [Aspergillus campestris IBT 28561]|uniref:Amidase family protein n=1 Tax=Aspergillus campestris (strain IBT 28561) TaxID=1392248 RepID=A0A2I1D8F6_ASPC2|nr:amidase family protein [Aspergillus campestris IBT 28561]PKY06155.1 amidase family protein [Aspergillus campestris IBT 28561]
MQMLLRALALVSPVIAISAPLHPFDLEKSSDGITYQLKDVAYFANVKYPTRRWTVPGLEPDKDLSLLTAVVTNQSVLTGDHLEDLLTSYLQSDDVMTEDFLQAIYLSSSASSARLDASAIDYLEHIHCALVFLDINFRQPVLRDNYHRIATRDTEPLPPGPYTARLSPHGLHLFDTYRLLSAFSPGRWGALIPVPSRIHARHDPRPLAGRRVAIKDLFDLQGTQTSAGSQAWIEITPVATSTAPAMQRLIDLGAVLVGKFKPGQFASGIDPWNWTDLHAPFNPRGDGYLTCSGSSSGGGCAIAAYDWLDAAIGTDTAVSMRRPAAVSGTYGNRPSQGMISMEGVVPLNWAQDTAGVFARDPTEWARFAKAWYTPQLHQNPSITGLPPLSVRDTRAFPRRLLYLSEYFPLVNPAAQTLVETALARVATRFNLTVGHLHLTNTVANASIFPGVLGLATWETVFNASSTMSVWPQWVDVVTPLVSTWARRHDGRYPPVDPAWRQQWHTFDPTVTTQTAYEAARQVRARMAAWFEQHILYETRETCSESILVCDISTGGLPSFREEALNDGPNATRFGRIPDGAVTTCGLLCAIFGCVDVTIPIGQVPYESPVTGVQEQWPVTINLLVRRGCDFMLFNMIEEMHKAEILRGVQTGRVAF